MDEETLRNGQTYPQRVKQGEQHAFWKLGLRTIICILDIIAIGCAGWFLTNAIHDQGNPYIGYFNGGTLSPWILLVCGVSFIFCLVCILVLLLRRPPKPAPPGIAVACDLLLWLAFVVTALFTTAAIIGLSYFNNTGNTLDDPNYSYNGDYSGEYYMAPNNTWVYNITYVSPYADDSSGSTTGYGDYFYNYTRHDYQLNRTRPSTSSVTRDCKPSFDSCAEQDMYINQLWHSRHERYATTVLAAAVQWLNLLLHFVLFVWACVDTARYNRAAKESKVNAVANRVIQDMQQRGLITVSDPAREGPEGQSLMAGGDPAAPKPERYA